MDTVKNLTERVDRIEDGVLYFKPNNKGVSETRKIKVQGSKYTFKVGGGRYSINPKTKKISKFKEIAVANTTTTPKEKPVIQSKFSINSRFSFLEKFTGMVLDNTIASLLVCGEGGLGKTFTIKQELENADLVEDIDYVIIKGYATPKALYATLWENRNKLVIFDDCDSVLKDPISLNILKGALDSYDKRTISWLSRGFITDELPSSFDFNGNVIFISNIRLSRVDGAVRSRTLSVDLSMTLEDKIARMKNILPDILPEYSTEIKESVINILDNKKDEAKELNIRTFEKAIHILSAYNGSKEGEDAIEYMLTNA